MPVTEQSLPLFVRLQSRAVLVAGAGRVAERRVERLLRAGARLRVVAPAASARVRELAEAGRIEWQQRPAVAADTAGMALVFAATNDTQLNVALARAARANGALAQCVHDAGESDFILPAVIERGVLQIAVSSDGRAPTLARLLRARLEAWIPRAYGDLAALADEFREQVKQRLPFAERAPFWSRVLDGPIAEKVFGGRQAEARRDLVEALAAAPDAQQRGEVYLVGGGPGDPDLLTFRALRLMQRADVVLYDSLIDAAILDLLPPHAERIHVGKRAARHTLPQTDINTLMVDLARQGKRVLRLKGGDPFVFGRGGEEIAELADAGVDFQIVPGITAANGCAAYAGIPLTHRDYAQSVIFVTGHLKQGELDLSWRELAKAGQTVVFFMGRKSLGTICERLQAHGLPPTWPAAMVIEGTTPRQRLVAATLADLPDKVAAHEVRGPALLIVGEVVQLHAQLGWFHPEDEQGAPAP